jgi:hypothetical protein
LTVSVTITLTVPVLSKPVDDVLVTCPRADPAGKAVALAWAALVSLRMSVVDGAISSTKGVGP